MFVWICFFEKLRSLTYKLWSARPHCGNSLSLRPHWRYSAPSLPHAIAHHPKSRHPCISFKALSLGVFTLYLLVINFVTLTDLFLKSNRNVSFPHYLAKPLASHWVISGTWLFQQKPKVSVNSLMCQWRIFLEMPEEPSGTCGFSLWQRHQMIIYGRKVFPKGTL